MLVNVGQTMEPETSNPRAGGSNPSGRASNNSHLPHARQVAVFVRGTYRRQGNNRVLCVGGQINPETYGMAFD